MSHWEVYVPIFSETIHTILKILSQRGHRKCRYCGKNRVLEFLVHIFGWVASAFLSIHIKIYLWSLADYQHLQKYFYNCNITLNYCLSLKSVSRVTLSGNAPASIKYPYFDAITLLTLKNCKSLKKLCAYSTKDHVLQIFEAHVGLRLEFASFGS